jgi:hypothetical protein
LDDVAAPYIPQCAEKRVSMPRHNGISGISRHRGARYVTGSAFQYVGAGSLKCHRGQAQPGYLQSSERFPLHCGGQYIFRSAPIQEIAAPALAPGGF